MRCFTPGHGTVLDQPLHPDGFVNRAGPLALDRDAISAACERYGVKRLVVFGFAVTDRLEESSSDVDFLVEFRNDLASRFDAYFGLKESLEALLGRSVDLVSQVALGRTPRVCCWRWSRLSTEVTRGLVIVPTATSSVLALAGGARCP
jgi:predicted nucleotidyltransferase